VDWDPELLDRCGRCSLTLFPEMLLFALTEYGVAGRGSQGGGS